MNAPEQLALKIALPRADGRIETLALSAPRAFSARPARAFTRIAYSAAHVVADPLATTDPWLDTAIDWDATIAYRRYLWSLGLGVAEAMDTAQRGMGLDWPTSLELIRHTLDAARDVPGALVASGAGTDHLAPEDARTIDDVIRAYEEQIGAIEALGGRIILMASRTLARVARSPTDYERVYDRVLTQAKAPVIIGATAITCARWTLPSESSMPTRRRSMASRSPCSMPAKRSRCGAALCPACACIRVTISITPS